MEETSQQGRLYGLAAMRRWKRRPSRDGMGWRNAPWFETSQRDGMGWRHAPWKRRPSRDGMGLAAMHHGRDVPAGSGMTVWVGAMRPTIEETSQQDGMGWRHAPWKRRPIGTSLRVFVRRGAMNAGVRR